MTSIGNSPVWTKVSMMVSLSSLETRTYLTGFFVTTISAPTHVDLQHQELLHRLPIPSVPR